MGADPYLGLLASGGDLRLGHLGSQSFESRFAVLVTLGKRDHRPEVGFGQIFWNSTPRPIVSAECSLRVDLPLFGGALEPLHGPHVVLGNFLTVVVTDTYLPLCIRVSLIGEPLQVC